MQQPPENPEQPSNPYQPQQTEPGVPPPPPYQQQPYTHYQQPHQPPMQPGMYPPPQQPYQYPPQVPPPKKRGIGKFFAIGCGSLVALVILVIVLAAVVSGGHSSSSSTTSTTTTQVLASQPTHAPTRAAVTPTSTHTPVWVTTHTFSGNGIKKTGFFTVPHNWRLFWKCDPSSSYGGSYNVIVYVYSSDGSLVDVAVNTICKIGNTGDSTDEHQGGQIYLDINSEAAWTIQVQELK
jgi:hypothetical protein